MAMERTAVNPVTWSAQMGFNHGELVAGHARTLYCSGQTAMSADRAPQHAGDLAAQGAVARRTGRDTPHVPIGRRPVRTGADAGAGCEAVGVGDRGPPRAHPAPGPPAGLSRSARGTRRWARPDR